MRQSVVLAILLSLPLFADGGSGSSGGSGGSTTSTATIRAVSAQTISGGTVQLQYLLSQPRPITYADVEVPSDGFSLNGVWASGPGIDASGVALCANGMIRVAIYSPDSTFGTSGYPILTLTVTAPQLPVGTEILSPIQAITMTGPSGSILLDDSHPPYITIGGSLSVSGVFPGGGTWPAGTVISVRGSGFQPRTSVNAHLQAGTPVYVSPNEMRLTLTQDQQLDSTQFDISNPDGSRQTFYSYPHGTLIQQPSVPLLQAADPIFSSVLRPGASLTVPSMQNAQFSAIALQNPNPGPISVTLGIAATGESRGIYMPSQSRLLEDLSVLFGRQLQPGEVISIVATSPIQMVGILGDSSASTLVPLLLSY